MKKLFLFIILIQLAPSVCNKEKEINYEEEIQGEWTTQGDFLYSLTFTEDNKYIETFYLEDTSKLHGHYKIDKDTIIFFKKNGIITNTGLDTAVFKHKHQYKIYQNQLILLNFKSIKDTEVHFDEITILNIQNSFKKKFNSENNFEIDSTLFVFENNFFGYVLINYNQPDGQEKKYTKNGTKIIDVPISGTLKTQFIADPLNYILKNIKFARKNNINKEIPHICFKWARSQKLEGLVELGYDTNAVYVILQDYNQMGRGYINEWWDEEITGQVLMFKIDTLKNLLIEPYPYK